MTNFESVRKFMETFVQEVKKKPGFPDDKTTSLRYNLINEELEELKDAISKKDIKEVADELTDIRPRKHLPYLVAVKYVVFNYKNEKSEVN